MHGSWAPRVCRTNEAFVVNMPEVDALAKGLWVTSLCACHDSGEGQALSGRVGQAAADDGQRGRCTCGQAAQKGTQEKAWEGIRRPRMSKRGRKPGHDESIARVLGEPACCMAGRYDVWWWAASTGAIHTQEWHT